MSTVEIVRISKNFILLSRWGFTITTATNVNFVFDGNTPSVILARKFDPDHGMRDCGLVTQTGMTNTGFGSPDENESVRQIMVRETEEESGIRVQPNVPKLFGYRQYDNMKGQQNSAQAYFVTIHDTMPHMRETGWEEKDEVLHAPQRIPLIDFFDKELETEERLRCMLAHRMAIALGFLSLERLGYADLPHVKHALQELGSVVSGRYNHYTSIARNKSPYLIISEAQE